MSTDTKQAIKATAWKYLGAMFLEVKDNGTRAVSMGRVAFLALFAQAMWIWSGWSEAVDLPGGMLTILGGLLAYITGTKVVDAIAARKA